MKLHLRRCASLIFGIAALSLAPAAGAARIEGLGAFEPVSAEAVEPAIVDGTMQIGLPDGRMLAITPWPKFLPQQFGKQTVTGVRQMHPAGPIDRLSLSRADESQPWLTIGSGARQSAKIVGNWQLRLSGRHWSIADGKTKKSLGSPDRNASPVIVNASGERWCVYLLDSAIPRAQPHLATEAEPQISWAAIRLHRLQKRCRPALPNN